MRKSPLSEIQVKKKSLALC